MFFFFFFFKQKTAYEMRISDWSSDLCSSDLDIGKEKAVGTGPQVPEQIHARQKGHRAHVLAGEEVAPAPARGLAFPIRLGGLRLQPARRFVHPRAQEGQRDGKNREIGRASCRERVCQYV